MNESKISVRYSRALFQSAVEKKILDKVNQDMTAISEICNIPEVRELLKNPVIVPSKKTEILHKIFGADLQKITRSAIDIMVKNGRENYIPAVARVFRHETLKYNGITESQLITAIKVDDRIKKQIIDLISSVFKTKVELKETVESEIIGGFILKAGDNYLDASVRSKLRKIKKELQSGGITSGR